MRANSVVNHNELNLFAAIAARWSQVCTGATTGAPIAEYPHPRTAVLAVDLQRDFLADDARMPIAKAQVEPLLRASNAVLDVAHEHGWRVITIGNEFSPSNWLVNLVQHGAAIRGTPGAALDPRIHPVCDAYFPKNSRDAFTNPALDALLRDQQVNHLIVFGVMANACVRATALGALNRGYRVTVVRDAVGAPSDAARDRALKHLAAAGAIVADAAATLAMPSLGNESVHRRP